MTASKNSKRICLIGVLLLLVYVHMPTMSEPQPVLTYEGHLQINSSLVDSESWHRQLDNYVFNEVVTHPEKYKELLSLVTEERMLYD